MRMSTCHHHGPLLADYARGRLDEAEDRARRLTTRNAKLGNLLRAAREQLALPPSVIGRNTNDNLKAGVVLGFLDLIDGLLVLTAIACTGYICVNLTAIFERQGDWLPADLVVSVVGTLLVLEACRRVIGMFMSAICIVGILYAMYGPYMPDLIIHKGYSIERIATTLWLTTEGIFGLPIGVAATFVFVFVLFGAFLESTGGGIENPPFVQAPGGSRLPALPGGAKRPALPGCSGSAGGPVGLEQPHLGPAQAEAVGDAAGPLVFGGQSRCHGGRVHPGNVEG